MYNQIVRFFPNVATVSESVAEDPNVYIALTFDKLWLRDHLIKIVKKKSYFKCNWWMFISKPQNSLPCAYNRLFISNQGCCLIFSTLAVTYYSNEKNNSSSAKSFLFSPNSESLIILVVITSKHWEYVGRRIVFRSCVGKINQILILLWAPS